jgi:hypothetical protein
MKWTQPVYTAQILTGVAGIGAILASDTITALHIVVAVVLAVSMAVSLMVVGRAEADAARNRAHLDTLMRAMELPYFIIDAVSGMVRAVASTRDWRYVRQHNFQDETVYQFESASGQPGRLLMTAQEFKDLWLLDERDRRRAIERRLFEPDLQVTPEQAARDAETAIREAISEHVKGPHWISESRQPDGTRVYAVRRDQTSPPFNTLVFTSDRFAALLATVPIRRYQELAEEVERAFTAPAATPPATGPVTSQP